MHDAGVPCGEQALELANDESNGPRLWMRSDSRLVHCASSGVGSLGTSSVNALDGDGDVIDQLLEFQKGPRFRPCRLKSVKSTLSRWRSRLECAEDFRRGHEGITPDIAFPNANDSPTECSQNTRHLPVPLAIPFDLRNPIWRIPTFRQLAFPLGPLTPVPKIAVAEDHNTMSRDHQVGTPDQCGRVQAIPNAGGPKSLSQEDLRSGILTTIASPNAARL